MQKTLYHRKPALSIFWLFLAIRLLIIAVAAENVSIQILQTTDVHGHFHSSEAHENRGGWLQIAPLLQDAISSHGRQRTLLFDCGDTFQGSFIETRERGAASIAMLDLLDYDVWVPGNHAFDFGLKRFLELSSRAEERVILGNFRCRDGLGHPVRFREWHLFERDGAKIAVIGGTSTQLHQWFWGEGWEHVQVELLPEMLTRLLPEILRAKPHMIALGLHQGWGAGAHSRGGSEVADIAAAFPEIDLILGGHTHRELSGQRIGPRTWYVQAGAHGASVVKVIADIDTEAGKVLNISSSLLLADPTRTMPLKALPAKLQTALQNADAAAKAVVAEITHTVSSSGMPGRNCGTSELISSAIASAAGVNAVVHGRLSGYDLPAGAVTEAALFRLVPYENMIAVAQLSEYEIIDIMQEQLEQRSSYVFCGPWGFHVHLNTAGDLVTDVSLADGSPWLERLPVAFNSYTVAGGGGRFPTLRRILRSRNARLRDTGMDTRAAVRRWLSITENTDSIAAPRNWFKGI